MLQEDIKNLKNEFLLKLHERTMRDEIPWIVKEEKDGDDRSYCECYVFIDKLKIEMFSGSVESEQYHINDISIWDNWDDHEDGILLFSADEKSCDFAEKMEEMYQHVIENRESVAYLKMMQNFIEGTAEIKEYEM